MSFRPWPVTCKACVEFQLPEESKVFNGKGMARGGKGMARGVASMLVVALALASGQAVGQGAEAERATLAQSDDAVTPERFVLGTHYDRLSPTQPTSSGPDQIEVCEIFWYGCPHCYTFEPHLESWKGDIASDVSFVRVPAVWNPLAQLHARAYYTAEVSRYHRRDFIRRSSGRYTSTAIRSTASRRCRASSSSSGSAKRSSPGRSIPLRCTPGCSARTNCRGVTGFRACRR